MPIIVPGSLTNTFAHVKDIPKIDYDYPYDLDFSPQSALHQRIVSRVMRLADESYSVMQRRHGAWRNVDRMMTGFIPLSDYERQLKLRKSGNEAMASENRPVSIVVPYSYVTHETIMTYMMQALFGAPTFQYEHTGPEDVLAVKLLELAVDAQVRRFTAPLSMHTSISDSLKYGFGATTFEWDQIWGRRPVMENVIQQDQNGRFLGVVPERTNERSLLFEGNRLVPLDPYKLLPDPNVSITDIQRGEFLGWIATPSFYDLLARERDDQAVFNVRYLDDTMLRQRQSRFTVDDSDREKRFGGGFGLAYKTNYTNYITVVHMFVTLIPREWGLPGDEQDNRSGEYPEKWLFSIANDLILVGATRHNLNHGMYPVSTVAPDYDGYSPTPIGRMEMLYGLQEGMNWLYNAHIANVRKAINDMFIVDPSLVVMSDMQRPGPGKLVRLRRRAWGRGVKDVVMQLSVNDITRSNINDSLYIADIMQRVSAAGDAVQGIVRSGGERRSATEYRSTVSNALSRLEYITRLVGMQYVGPLGYMYASQTQQFMSQPMYARIVGQWPQTLQNVYQNVNGLYVNPEDILVDFDVMVKDGSIPSAGSGNADLYIQLFSQITTNPELAQMFDVPRLFTRIATMLGDKNAYDFVRKGGNAVTIPAEQGAIEAAVQQGNLLPLAA